VAAGGGCCGAEDRTTQQEQQMTERWRLSVTGEVHGVGYRASCLRHARHLGLAGWVRNRPDGSVEIEAEGPVDRLENLRSWAAQGPPAARVDGVTCRRVDTVRARGFTVLA
jgi:acylphosphatase